MATKPRRVTRQLAAQERAKENSNFESLPVSAPRRRRQRGLERLTEMPLDIVMEIMFYLGPMDLLHLIRTNKAFRRFLLARSSEPLWKAARKNVDLLPECPEHMSEPAYANLVFDAHCHKCLKSGTKAVHWSFGARYCPTCRPTMLVKCNGGACLFGDTCSDALMPHMHDRATYAHYHHLPDVEWLEEKGKGLGPKDALARKRTVSKIMDHASECEDWQNVLARTRQTELHNLRRRRLDGVVQKLRDLGFGEDLATMEPVYVLLKEHPDVKPSRELTDRGESFLRYHICLLIRAILVVWKTIRPRMVKFMEGFRTRRLTRERCLLLIDRGRAFADVYREWWARQDERAALPRWGEMLRRTEVRSLVDQPNEVDVARGIFEPLSVHFPQWTQEWREERDVELRTIVLNSSEFKDRIPEGVDPLSLASVVFDCAHCGCNIYTDDEYWLPPIYPSILGHDCLNGYVDAWSIGLDDPLECALICATPTGWNLPIFDGFRWSSEPLCIGVLHRWAVEVIKACGKDPMTTTREEMDRLDVRFWCETCCEPYRGQRRQVMKWRDTLLHHAAHDKMNGFSTPKDYASLKSPPEHPVKWSVMSGDIITTIKDAERVADPFFERDFKTSPEVTWYDCTHCDEEAMSYIEIGEHLFDEHDIEHVQPHDIYRTPDVDLTMVKSITLIKLKPMKDLTNEEAALHTLGRAYFCDF